MATCSKRFTLHIDPEATVCPALQATVALGVGAVSSHFAFYANSATPGIPHKYFANGLTSMLVINADTRAIVTTVNLALRFPTRHGVVAAAANKILYIVNDGATGFWRIEGMDIDNYAVTGTAYTGIGEPYEYVDYDPVHNEIGSFFVDAGAQPWFRRHNATTMALIASTMAGAVAANNWTISCDPSRNLYWTGYDAAGFSLRAYDRTTGAVVIDIPFPNQITAVLYEPTADALYALDINSNFYRCNPATGAVELAVGMGAINGLQPIAFWPNNNCLVGMAPNPGGEEIIGVDGTHVCSFTGAGVTVGIFNDELAVRNFATNNLLIYSI